MIDWLNLAANSLWILACAAVLAALSRASWESSARGVKLRRVLGEPGYQLALAAAGILFCLGLAGTAGSTVEMVIWLALGAGFVLRVITLIAGVRKDGSTPSGGV